MVWIHNNYFDRKGLTNNRLGYGVMQLRCNAGYCIIFPVSERKENPQSRWEVYRLRSEPVASWARDRSNILSLQMFKRINFNQLHVCTYCRFSPDAAEIYLTLSVITFIFQFPMSKPGRSYSLKKNSAACHDSQLMKPAKWRMQWMGYVFGLYKERNQELTRFQISHNIKTISCLVCYANIFFPIIMLD